MRISDWSSDVCSSDLGRKAAFGSRDLRPPFPYPAAAHEGACLGRSAAVRHTDRLMMKKLAIVAACIAAFPSPASADRVQPPAATPGPIIVDGRARVDSRMPDQMTPRSEEHTSELQSLMRISYAVFCLKKKKTQKAQP